MNKEERSYKLRNIVSRIELLEKIISDLRTEYSEIYYLKVDD